MEDRDWEKAYSASALQWLGEALVRKGLARRPAGERPPYVEHKQQISAFAQRNVASVAQGPAAVTTEPDVAEVVWRAANDASGQSEFQRMPTRWRWLSARRSEYTLPMPDSTNDANLGPGTSHRMRGVRLRDGPLFVSTTFVIALVGAAIAAVPVAVVFAVTAAVKGERSTEQIIEATQSPAATWITLVVSQAVFLAIALVACRIVAAPPRDRLGLAVPAIGRGDAAILLVATIVPFVIGLFAASVVPSFGGDSVRGLTRMWAEGTRTTSVLWVLTISLMPAIVEEMFHRGFVLRGFLMRWPPVAAIFASSSLFAIAHLDPAHAALTFVVGIWFGVVAWRTGSVVLPILMHAGMNGSWTTIQMIAARSSADDDTSTIAWVITIGVGAAAFFLAIRVLRRCSPQAHKPRVTSRSPMRSFALAGAGLAAVAALLFSIIPPGAIKPGLDGPPAPTVISLREQVGLTVACPNDGEANFELQPGSAVRVELAPNRVGVQEVIVALDATSTTIWLAYDGELSGKKVGIGIVEQLRGGDPAVVLMRHEGGPSGLSASNIDGCSTSPWATARDSRASVGTWSATAILDCGRQFRDTYSGIRTHQTSGRTSSCVLHAMIRSAYRLTVLNTRWWASSR